MSKYTKQLRYICQKQGRETVEAWFKDYDITDYLTSDQIDVLALSPWSKDKLAKKIVDHYFMQEIGFETPALFAHYAKITMEEIMEEMLPMLYSRAIKYDPLINVDFTETFSRRLEADANSTSGMTSQGTSTSTSDSDSSGLGIENRTPQKKITKQDLNTGAYASNVSQSDNHTEMTDVTTTTGNQSSTSNQDQTQVENYTRSQRGNSGVSATAQKMVEQFRDNVMAIDRQIIERLEDLFMFVY